MRTVLAGPPRGDPLRSTALTFRMAVWRDRAQPRKAETGASGLVRYRQLVDALPKPKATRGLHPIAQKLVKEDDRIASLSRPYSWGKNVSLALDRWNRITGVQPVLDAPDRTSEQVRRGLPAGSEPGPRATGRPTGSQRHNASGNRP